MARCPECDPIERALNDARNARDDLRYGSGRTAFESELDLRQRAVRSAIEHVLNPALQARADAEARLAAAVKAHADLYARVYSVLDAGMDPTKVSLTPRPGWIEWSPAPGIRLWLVDEDAREMAEGVLNSMSSAAALAAAAAAKDAALAEVRAANDRVTDAQDLVDAKERAVEDHIAQYEARLADLERRIAELEAALARCEASCGKASDVGRQVAAVLGAVLLGAGGAAVVIGAPFDTAAVAAVVEPAATAAPTETATPTEPPTTAPPTEASPTEPSPTEPRPTEVTVVDACTGTDHFPEEPVNGAPSKQVVTLALAGAEPGATVQVIASGPHPTFAEGVVDENGVVVIELPLADYGEFTIASVNYNTGTDGDYTPLDPTSVTPTGTFTVADPEQPCDETLVTPAGGTGGTEPTTAPPTTGTGGAPPTTGTGAPTTPDTTAPGGGSTAPPTTGTDAGTGTDTDPETDTDETRPGLVAGGAATAALGGALLAGAPAGTRRRRDEDAATDTGDSNPDADAAADRERREALFTAERAQLEALQEAETDAADAELDAARGQVATATEELVSATKELRDLEREEEDEWFYEGVTDWLTGDDDEEAAAVTAARRRVATAATSLRTAQAGLVAAELARHEDLESRTRAATAGLRESRTRLQESRRVAQTVARRSQPIESTDETRTAQLARSEATLHARRIEEEAWLLVTTHLEPIRLENNSAEVSSTAAEIERISYEIAERRTDTSSVDTDDEKADAWLRSVDRAHLVEQFRTLTTLGTFVDPQNGQVIEGPLRTQVAADRIGWLADYTSARAWDDEDSRNEVAADLRSELATTYRPLTYLEYGTADMADYFRSVAHTIRTRESEIEDWFVTSYLGQSADAPDGALDAAAVGFNTGIGTKLRVLDIGDEDATVTAVRSRIQRMHADADVAVAALTAAASTPDPADLAPEHFETLAQFGYIAPDHARPDGWRYTIPTRDRAAEAATAVDLPGATWLDVVSARTAAETLASVVVPELAAARVAAIAGRLGATTRTVRALRLLADHGLGTAMDVGFEYARGNTDVGRVFVDSLVGSAVSSLSRRTAGRALDATTLATARRAGREADTVAELLQDSTARRAAYQVISEITGVTAESLAQSVQQAVTTGTLTEEDVLASLLANTLNRGVSAYGTAKARELDGWLTTRAPEALARVLPEPLATRVREHPAFAKELSDTALHDAEADRAASAAFDRVLGDRPRTAASAPHVHDALLTGELTWSELQRAYATQGPQLDALMQGVARERDAFFDSVVTTAREVARRDIDDHFRSELDAALGIDDDATRDRRIDMLESQRADELARLDAPVIRPGSAGPTSDIDRSWGSEFLRRAAQKVIDLETRRRLAGDDTLPPTTARAVDVNEYYNVMTAIGRIAERRSEFADLTVTTRTVDGTDVHLTHADVVEGNGLAAAMLHMTPSQRRRFAENQLAGLPEGSDARRTRQAQLDHAADELAASEAALASETARVAEELGLDPTDPETELRARDRLYGRRMQRLVELEQGLASVPRGSEAERELMSTWERELNTALRDGIETYSDLANLDIIVTRMQSQRDANGDKLTPEALMRSESFRTGEGGALAHVTTRQITGMLNDQTLMIMHHVNGFHGGHESAAKATRSLAKYVERALLALNLRGDHDPSDAGSTYRRLHEITAALVPYKDQSALLVRELMSQMGTTDPEEALRRYLTEIEVLPGLAGLTAPPPTAERPRWSSSLFYRAWQRAADAARTRPAGAVTTGGLVVESMTELEEVDRELRTLEHLASTYREEDWGRARALEDEQATTGLRARLLYGHSGRTHQVPSQTLSRLLQHLRDVGSQLAALRERGPGPISDRGQERLDRLRARRASLLARLDQAAR